MCAWEQALPQKFGDWLIIVEDKTFCNSKSRFGNSIQDRGEEERGGEGRGGEQWDESETTVHVYVRALHVCLCLYYIY